MIVGESLHINAFCFCRNPDMHDQLWKMWMDDVRQWLDIIVSQLANLGLALPNFCDCTIHSSKFHRYLSPLQFIGGSLVA